MPQIPQDRQLTAHPRIRGEYLSVEDADLEVGGSPPHSRGIPHPCLRRADEAGLTPAFAGNTGTSVMEVCPAGAHPRIRGEYSILRITLGSLRGSPPHSRGIPWKKPPGRVASGLTPAFAGNTVADDQRHRVVEAHPRIRGEYGPVLAYPVAVAGSPPHSRGILRDQVVQEAEARLTPAFAGNTVGWAREYQVREAHPRIRGEYQEIVTQPFADRGSPPHSRGIQSLLTLTLTLVGLTPAFAGNTETTCARSARPRAHPRIRGEYLPQSRRTLRSDWLTPAFAGNTFSPSSW